MFVIFEGYFLGLKSSILRKFLNRQNKNTQFYQNVTFRSGAEVLMFFDGFWATDFENRGFLKPFLSTLRTSYWNQTREKPLNCNESEHFRENIFTTLCLLKENLRWAFIWTNFSKLSLNWCLERICQMWGLLSLHLDLQFTSLFCEFAKQIPFIRGLFFVLLLIYPKKFFFCKKHWKLSFLRQFLNLKTWRLAVVKKNSYSSDKSWNLWSIDCYALAVVIELSFFYKSLRREN